MVYNPGSQPSAVYVTRDGGQTWGPLTTPVGQMVEAADFIDAEDGWLLTVVQTADGNVQTQSVWATRDGGRTWMRMSDNGEISGLDFVTEQLGWATTPASTGASVPELLQTTDAGHTWAPVVPQVGG